MINELRKLCEDLHKPFAGMLATDPRSDEEVARYEAEQERNIDHANDNRI